MKVTEMLLLRKKKNQSREHLGWEGGKSPVSFTRPGHVSPQSAALHLATVVEEGDEFGFRQPSADK